MFTLGSWEQLKKRCSRSVAHQNTFNADLEFIRLDGINAGYLLVAKRSAM
jgi:hypothetical protein